MPATFGVASSGVVSSSPSPKFTFPESLKEQIAQQNKFIENLLRNLENYRTKILVLESPIKVNKAPKPTRPEMEQGVESLFKKRSLQHWRKKKQK